MKSTVLFFCLAAFSLSACNQTSKDNQQAATTDSLGHESMAMDTVHTSQNSLDWAGTYEATIPCADCEGIKTNITLKNDNSFSITSEYINKNSRVVDSGKVMWHDNGSVVHLTGKETNMKLKVGENRLIGLDQEGHEIEGPNAHLYVYNKVEGEK
ncbi:copper resistance protein NlpE N-terminal domain-containing protein [Sphingobacterium sp. N143]|uniref:copper resistance protein NlpE n=1 Tax=Sphingobacterium sp. N143 TaxID=2746727 RepID=UPI00257668B8|nr:copper resistance protein NlpE [Sphingobacterium sp. N143]MDM1293703.1 copper resistance protein NlpE N-terminal domain-containing protein [Sphingobacterium sp. N143]